MTVDKRLSGKVAVVTGASSGIGRAIVRALGLEGARVGLVARGRDGLEAAAREVKAAGGEALVLPTDVSDAAAVGSAAERVVREWGRIDIWINDAMITVLSPVHQMAPEEYRRVTEVNYLGTVHGTLTALKHMRPRDAGLIIQIGSALAYRSIPLQSAYCATKAAIRGFTDSLRAELIRERSRIALTMLQLPGVNTPQFEVMRNRMPKHPKPVPPVYQPELIADAVLYAIRRPSREMWIGWSTVMAIMGQRVIPGVLDWHLSRRAFEGQQTDALSPTYADNLDSPLPGDRGAHGAFDDQSRPRSIQFWLRSHPALVGLVLGVLVGVLALVGTGSARF